MMRNFRRVWPPTWLVATAVFGYLAATYGLMAVAYVTSPAWNYPIPSEEKAALARESMQTLPHQELGGLWLILTCGFYGSYRVWTTHPVFYFSYWEWLSSTPWTIGKPLPLGPIHLVFADALVLGVSTLLILQHPQWSIFHPLVGFLCGHLLLLFVAFTLTGPWQIWHLLLGGAVVLLRIESAPHVVAVAFSLLVFISGFGVRSSLKRMREWDFSQIGLIGEFPSHATPKAKPNVGWPFHRLSPQRDKRFLSSAQSFSFAGLAALWVFMLGQMSEEFDHRNVLVAVASFGFILPFSRVVLYVVGYAPPINLVGRFMTGRWIIPGYDVVCLPMLWVGLADIAALSVIGSGPELNMVMAPLLAATQVLIVCLSPPDLETWRLTAPCRILTTGISNNGKFQQTQ